MISPRFLIRICATLLFPILLFALPANAQISTEARLTALQADLQEKQAELEAFDVLLTQEGLTNKQLNKARDKLRLLRDHFQTVDDEVTPLHKTALADVSDLGEPPAPTAEGEAPAPEPDGIRELRAQLTEKAHALESTLKLAEASHAKTLRSLEKITSLRRGMFVSRLMERQTLPFDLALWKTGHTAMMDLQKKIATLVHNTIWQESHMKIALLIALLLIGGSTISMRRFLRAKLAHHQEDSVYTPFALASLATIIPFCGMLVALFIVFQALSVAPDLDQTALDFAKRVLLLSALAIFLITAARNLAIAGTIRKAMKWLLILSGLLYGADSVLMEYGRIAGSPIEMIVAHSYVFSSIFACLLLVFSSLTLRSKSGRARFFLPKKIFYLFPLAGVFILAANVFGYVSLTRYLSTQIALVGFFLTFVLMLRGSLRPSLYQLDAFVHRGLGGTAEEAQTTDAAPEVKDEKLVFFWASLTLDMFLALLSIPVFAGMFGTEWLEIKEWGIKAFYGVQVGGITISIAKISLSIVVFFVLLFLTRSLQRVLGQRILPKTKIEDSVRSSLVQILGYAGTIIALFAGLSAFGFNLTNLALIAGALSVGIGFGLQSIVNNFVSGLILLFERPIKTGDWVVVSSGEGIVKSINVRSTEIETFDRTSIIVPNSELISSSVKNWTHSDKIGRVVIPVGVSYSADPKTVHDILLACAEKNSFSIKNPAPTVVFKDFGDSALIFDLRFFIRNIGDVFKASTQARFDIWYALKENNIEIPFPQRDLHIRSDATQAAPRKTAAKKKKA
ncbi:MAG: mechanosensitive ion channel family protein [Alphaproteobacteria bacterium]|nr:MAG: mechanosensitive ion channel family protein [Alphaproteobacteria bacterium]